MTFKTSSALLALTLSAFAVSGLHAQTTREAVKAEAAAAAPTKATGEMSVANQDKGSKPMPSETTRAAVKADAKTARDAGQITSGERSTATQGKKPPRRSSTKSRAAVKAEAAAANKAGGLSRGESSTPNQDRGGVKP